MLTEDNGSQSNKQLKNQAIACHGTVQLSKSYHWGSVGRENGKGFHHKKNRKERVIAVGRRAGRSYRRCNNEHCTYLRVEWEPGMGKDHFRVEWEPGMRKDQLMDTLVLLLLYR